MLRIRTRFAPSPTGKLHLGHVLAARVAYALALQNGGEFMLRHEDIDGPRVREEFYAGIEQDLSWLGLPWTGAALRQTERLSAYESALATLREMGVVYPCFCTRGEIRQEIERMSAAPHGPEPAVYPGICRRLDPADLELKLAAGIPYAWRLNGEKAAKIAGELVFQDLRFGEIAVDPRLLGDVVLARKGIGTAYHLAVVVDDAFQEITHVTRGEDLLSSTHVHRLLQVLLGLPEPIYLHHGLILDGEGKRLAKRNESLSIAYLRENGCPPAEILAATDDVFQAAFSKNRVNS